MKQTDRLKKEKSPTVKTAILANTKKADPKKAIKKEEVPIPKSNSPITQHSASLPGTQNWSLESPQGPNPQSSSIRWRLP